MIQVDARTNPFTWRRCVHVLNNGRCVLCGVVIHEGVYIQREHRVSVDSPVMAMAEFSQPEEAVSAGTCTKGHARRLTLRITHGKPVLYPICDTCKAEEREALLASPCPYGHVGARYLNNDGSRIRCRLCNRKGGRGAQ